MAYGNPPRRLYVLELADGTIKAGIARDSAKQRIGQHKLKHEVVNYFVSDKYITGIEAERELLARIARIGTLIRGREWFSGVTFAQATEIVREVAEQFAHADQSPVPSPLLRKSYAKLSFSERELAVLDAYCAKFGLERSAACRKLALEAVSSIRSA